MIIKFILAQLRIVCHLNVIRWKISRNSKKGNKNNTNKIRTIVQMWEVANGESHNLKKKKKHLNEWKNEEGEEEEE